LNTEVAVYETATPENLFPPGYVTANPDLQRLFGRDRDYESATEHFHLHGTRERRKQATRAYYEWRHDKKLQRDRFKRFRKCFRLAPWKRSFPLRFGSHFLDVEKYLGESANPAPVAFLDELRNNPDKLYADIGAGLRNVVCSNCVYVEVYPSLTTDIVVEPSCKLPFRTASLDGIGCFAVLEHVTEPWKLAGECARVVKPGGKIFIEWPFLQPVHGYPSHYYNATREGLRNLFAAAFDVREVITGAHQGPDFTVAWILQSLLRSIGDPEARDRLAGMTVAELAAEPQQSALWQRALKSVDDAAISELSCGNTLVGVRKQAS
jgi:SAM-dependent methyltransferase